MLRSCEKASLYDAYGEHVADASVEIINDEYVLLIFPDEEVLGKLKKEMTVTFYDDEQGMVTCDCEMTKAKGRLRLHKAKEMAFPYASMFQIREQKAVVQRRADVKVKVWIPLELRLLGGEKRNVAIMTKDISAGGIGFTVREKLEVGQQFTFLFSETEYPLQLRGKVVWSVAVKGKVDTWQCGAQFLDMTLAKESIVRKFVFQEQLKRCGK